MARLARPTLQIWLGTVPAAAALGLAWGLIQYDLIRPDGQQHAAEAVIVGIALCLVGVVAWSYGVAAHHRRLRELGVRNPTRRLGRIGGMVHGGIFAFVWGVLPYLLGVGSLGRAAFRVAVWVIGFAFALTQLRRTLEHALAENEPPPASS